MKKVTYVRIHKVGSNEEPPVTYRIMREEIEMTGKRIDWVSVSAVVMTIVVTVYLWGRLFITG